ncbi:prolyl-tRNA synthetase associated domain-containing protein [Bauldia sp.]|uniref:prolyl-tRNA synthetase associated domain-containing protein n=1 Tax=Bauldia sp. TaxID=2575872 RepID=UPI003BAB89DF
MPATIADLEAYLGELGIETKTVTHPPLHTVAESRALRGSIPGAHTKNLFLRDKKGALFLVTALEDAEIDLKRLHARIGASGRFSFGKPDLLLETLGVVPGAVTPFGLINDSPPRLQVVFDAALMANGEVNCHPLVNTATTTIAAEDLIAFARATDHDPQVIAIDEASRP